MEINAYNVNSLNSNTNSLLSANKASLEMDDFLNLLVAQMKNQDAMNPMENTEFVSQLAQFSSLQAMSSLQETSKQSQATSLIGKVVVMASYDNSGNLVVTEGAVDKVTIHSGETLLYVNGEAFELSNVMEIKETEESNPLQETLGKILEEITNIKSQESELETQAQIETESGIDKENSAESE